MKVLSGLLLFALSTAASAQAWKVLPKGVRIIGYRNVTTSKINQNYNQAGSQAALGTSFRVDAKTFNEMTGNAIVPGPDINPEAYNAFLVGAYKVDAQAQVNVHGTGFGYGITDKVMFYGEVAHYTAQVKTKLQRTANNTYAKTADILARNSNSLTDATLAQNLRNLPDVDESTIQSVVTDYYGYKPVGDWYGSGYGDMETGLMAKVIDRGVWGLMIYPGLVLPTGRQDDPDILQDMGFGDGQFDIFTEAATGYVYNDHLSFGTTLRYTYQAPTSKELRVPTQRDFMLSSEKGKFNVKYGDKINWMFSSTVAVNDWISFSPIYRYLKQMPSQYTSRFNEANDFLSYNSDKEEHQVQLTTSFSSVKPFLKKAFLLPAQINVNVVQTVSGKNVPSMGRFEIELRMMF